MKKEIKFIFDMKDIDDEHDHNVIQNARPHYLFADGWYDEVLRKYRKYTELTDEQHDIVEKIIDELFEFQKECNE